jgi:hypothetical protein
MDAAIAFSTQYKYDTLKIGVTVPVTLRLNGDTVDFEAKVDTGAENCIFEKIHGERLGLIIESGREQIFSTAAGIFTAYGHELTINVLEIEFDSTVYFAKEDSFTRNVLGRQGWLDRVKLGLIDYEGKLFLNEYNK